MLISDIPKKYKGATGSIVSDGFNRADNTTLGNAETGQAWSGDFGISGNKAYGKLSTDALAIIDSGMSNCDISVTLSTYISASYSGLIARFTDANNYLRCELNSGTVYINLREGGTSSLLAYSSGKTFNDGDIIKMRINNTAISVYHNGTLIVSTTSSFNQTATKHGIRTYQNLARFDDFKVEAL